jgi:SPP1 gp7 family putative phage head morphogenesis protein
MRIDADVRLKEALKKRAEYMSKRKKKVKLRMPRIIEPRAIERSYRALLIERQAKLVELVESQLIGRLSEIIKVRTDGLADDMYFILNGVRVEFARVFPSAKTRSEAQKAADEVSNHNRSQVKKVLKSTLQLDLFRSEPWLKDQIDIFVEQNVGLIKTVDEKYFGEVQEIVFRGARTGSSVKEIAEEIRNRGQVSRSRAELIARDQINKFNGNLSEIRQRDLGVTRYIWRTSLDERVREEHRKLEGKEFSWSKPPSEGHPGEAINCRCYAEPILTDILNEE